MPSTQHNRAGAAITANHDAVAAVMRCVQMHACRARVPEFRPESFGDPNLGARGARPSRKLQYFISRD
jgi:hypothetical protein